MKLYVLTWKTQWDNHPPENSKRPYWSEKQARKYIESLKEYHNIYAAKNIPARIFDIELFELDVPNPRQLPV